MAPVTPAFLAVTIAPLFSIRQLPGDKRRCRKEHSVTGSPVIQQEFNDSDRSRYGAAIMHLLLYIIV